MNKGIGTRVLVTRVRKKGIGTRVLGSKVLEEQEQEGPRNLVLKTRV